MTHRTVAALGAIASLIAFVASAFAHSWYPAICCSGYDCAPIAATRVKLMAGNGYMIDGKHYVPADQVKRSEDGEYHACFPTPDNLRCFFAPPQGS